MKTVFRLMEVENSHPITAQTEPEFLALLQRSILLGLKEMGALNETQYRRAEEALLRQYRNAKPHASSDGKKGGNGP